MYYKFDLLYVVEFICIYLWSEYMKQILKSLFSLDNLEYMKIANSIIMNLKS